MVEKHGIENEVRYKMADIELVIKIPEEAYKLLKNEGVDWLGAEHILNAVANGTPLPKGHGVLKDADELLKHAHTIGTSNYCEYNVVYVETIKEAKPIIEADKE